MRFFVFPLVFVLPLVVAVIGLSSRNSIDTAHASANASTDGEPASLEALGELLFLTSICRQTALNLAQAAMIRNSGLPIRAAWLRPALMVCRLVIAMRRQRLTRR